MAARGKSVRRGKPRPRSKGEGAVRLAGIPSGKPGLPVVATGRAVGEGVVTGLARFVASTRDLDLLRPGEILMMQSLAPGWADALGRAAAIVTNEDLASDVAQRLGVPAVLGTVNGASPMWSGATLAVSCQVDGLGVVYECPGAAA
jgi:pyruvate,water dikinase